MMLWFLLLALFTFVYCDIEKLDKHFNGNPHVPEFAVPEIQLENRLHLYFRKIDSNHDNFIERDELASWIHKTYESLDREHAEKQLMDFDKDKDGRVSFHEYVSHSYETSEEELKNSKDDQSSKFILESLKSERSRFNFADKNGDGFLSLREFTIFLRPENYEDMANYELQTSFSIFDQNNDGVITSDEFTNFSYRGVSQQNYLREQFKLLDVDHNRLLTSNELRPWLLPSLKSAAESEATRLMNITDSNHDGKLTLDEVLAKSQSWKDSHVVKHSRSLWDEL
ncbi:unnamed protein product [Trichobilharzia szidati]|nr:unnamed protein product [Trichobilharzia szidati]